MANYKTYPYKIMQDASEFIDGLTPVEKVALLHFARKAMRKMKVSEFPEDRALKTHMFLLDRIDKYLKGEEFTGYVCDHYDCMKEAAYYNSNQGAFYCEEHN